MQSKRIVFLLFPLIGAFPAAAADEPAKISLRVLCYNIHHGEGTDGNVDLPRLAKVIKDARPDLVALQEVDKNTRRTGGVDQTAELAKFTGLHGRFGKQIDYEGGEYGQAILSRFPIRELTVHWLPGMPDRERRIAASAPIVVGGREITFVTTHLHHQRKEFRESQATELNKLFGHGDKPAILAGDLNATPDEKPIAILAEKWTMTNPKPPALTYPSGIPTKRLDYILCRQASRFVVVSTSVIDEPVASDHRPVLTVVEMVR